MKKPMKSVSGCYNYKGFPLVLLAVGHNGEKAKGCQRPCFDMCGVAHHAEDTLDRAPDPTDDIAALQNQQGVMCWKTTTGIF